MIDREKVIKGLRVCSDVFLRCEQGCPYFNEIEPPYCNELKKDALALLLKEQEAVEPRCIDGKRNHFIKCGNCNYDLLTGYMFCPHCGKPITWEKQEGR